MVRVYHDNDSHTMVDYCASVTLTGKFSAVYLHGDNANCLATDTVKNIIYAFAKEHGAAAGQPESFGLLLARHFVEVPSVCQAKIELEMYPWIRLESGGIPHPHAFQRDGSHVRVASVTCEADRELVESGVRDLVMLKTTDSEFRGFYQDRYTTLAPADNRILATSVTGRWTHAVPPADWQISFESALAALTGTFAEHRSLSLQQTLFQMGTQLISAEPGVCKVWLSLPNCHHVVVGLSPFGLDNPNEILHPADRPYGLIEGAVHRSDQPD